MNTTQALSSALPRMLLVPVAIAFGLAAAPARAYDNVTVAVPAIVIDVNGVLLTLGAPPPPPEVIVVREPAVREVVYRDVYHDVMYRDVVVVHERQRPTQVVYVRHDDDDRGCRKPNKHNKHDKHDNHGRGKYRR